MFNMLEVDTLPYVGGAARRSQFLGPFLTVAYFPSGLCPSSGYSHGEVLEFVVVERSCDASRLVI